MAVPPRSKLGQLNLCRTLTPVRLLLFLEVTRSPVFRRDCSTIVANSESRRRTYRQPDT